MKTSLDMRARAHLQLSKAHLHAHQCQLWTLVHLTYAMKYLTKRVEWSNLIRKLHAHSCLCLLQRSFLSSL